MHLFSFNFISMQYLMVFSTNLTDEPNTKVERIMGCFCGLCDYIVHLTKIRRIICFALETHPNSIIFFFIFFRFIFYSFNFSFVLSVCSLCFFCCYTSVFIQFEFVSKIRQESFGNIDSAIAQRDHRHWRQFNQINSNPDRFE